MGQCATFSGTGCLGKTGHGPRAMFPRQNPAPLIPTSPDCQAIDVIWLRSLDTLQVAISGAVCTRSTLSVSLGPRIDYGGIKPLACFVREIDAEQREPVREILAEDNGSKRCRTDQGRDRDDARAVEAEYQL